MEKKLIKAILDVIKDVKDRPSIYGVWFEGHEHISGVPHIYFTDGYVAVRVLEQDGWGTRTDRHGGNQSRSVQEINPIRFDVDDTETPWGQQVSSVQWAGRERNRLPIS